MLLTPVINLHPRRSPNLPLKLLKIILSILGKSSNNNIISNGKRPLNSNSNLYYSKMLSEQKVIILLERVYKKVKINILLLERLKIK